MDEVLDEVVSTDDLKVGVFIFMLRITYWHILVVWTLWIYVQWPYTYSIYTVYLINGT